MGTCHLNNLMPLDSKKCHTEAKTSNTSAYWQYDKNRNRTKTAFLPKTKPKLTEVMGGETATSLVSQGSVSGPLLFILCTTSLSYTTSPVNHQLYADDTQPIMSLSASYFVSDITHLHQSVADIYSWMSSNFLLIALKVSSTH
jgi:hypothetical protein